MTAAQEQLITENYALAPFCARKYAPLFPWLGHDDLLSIAQLGLVYAAKNYNAEHGSFSTYAVFAIRREYMKETNARNRKKRKTTLVELSERMATPQADMEFSMDVKNTLKDATRGVTEREQQCFMLHYVHGYSFREIGQAYGITYQRAQLLTERVAKRFRMFWELDHRGEAV
jgi:RNA polymerase sigma factor (sigma-70 family)